MGDPAVALRTYRSLVAARVRAEWQYRTSFVLLLLSQALVAALDFLTIAVIFGNVDALSGWSMAEVAVLYGINGVAFGLADVVASPVELVAAHIRRGTFDVLLVRPVAPLLQLLASEFELRRVGRLLQPAVVLGIALPLTAPASGPSGALLALSAVASGAVLYSAIWVLTSAIAFWTVESQELANSFTYGGSTLAAYPIDVFGAWLRRIVVFLVPVAFVAYLPAAALLDKPVALGLPQAMGWASPAVALLAAAAAWTVWQTAVRHYRSTGS